MEMWRSGGKFPNFRGLSTTLIFIGLLPVITIPVFHLWLLITGFPPVLIGCVLCLIGGIVLRRASPRVRLPKKYLAAVPNGDDSQCLHFNEEGFTLPGDGTDGQHISFSSLTRLYQSNSCFYLVIDGEKLLILPHKDFVCGLPAEFREWIKEKTGKTVEYVK